MNGAVLLNYLVDKVDPSPSHSPSTPPTLSLSLSLSLFLSLLLLLLPPLNGQHHYVDDSVVRRLSRAGNWWVRDRDHHSLSPQQVTHLPPVWDLLLPLA